MPLIASILYPWISRLPSLPWPQRPFWEQGFRWFMLSIPSARSLTTVRYADYSSKWKSIPLKITEHRGVYRYLCRLKTKQSEDRLSTQTYTFKRRRSAGRFLSFTRARFISSPLRANLLTKDTARRDAGCAPRPSGKNSAAHRNPTASVLCGCI